MDFYIIPTLKNLELTYAGDRVFCLAHFYKQYPHYRQFFLDIRAKYPKMHITLDNSAAERALVTESVLLQIVGELKPTEVIAPDILFDADATLSNLDSFISKMEKANYFKHTQVFGCPQGKTKEDWITCYDRMNAHPYVSVIGMSKIAIPYAWRENPQPDQEIMETRHEAVNFLLETKRIVKPLHFLGMGDPREYAYYRQLGLPQFRSSDSCYTILAAVNGIDFSVELSNRVETTERFYETKLVPEQVNLALSNIAFLKWYTNYS